MPHVATETDVGCWNKHWVLARSMHNLHILVHTANRTVSKSCGMPLELLLRGQCDNHIPKPQPCFRHRANAADQL
jgi:hypothetical protein